MSGFARDGTLPRFDGVYLGDWYSASRKGKIQAMVSANSDGLSILAGAQTGVSEEDARIVRGLRAGIDDAYEELIRRFEQPIYSIAYRLLGNQTEACDVVQEVFLKVFRGRQLVSRAEQPSNLDLPDCGE